MSGWLIRRAAQARLDDIYWYTLETWGDAQAARYIRALFDAFGAIASRRVRWRPIPTEYGVEGWFHRHERHVIYWRLLADGRVGISSVLHQNMDQSARLRDDIP